MDIKVFSLNKEFFCAYRKVIWSTGRKKKENRGVDYKRIGKGKIEGALTN